MKTKEVKQEILPDGRHKIGDCAVDSGQLILIDPCYLKEWKDDEFSSKKHKGKYKETGKLSYSEACAITMNRTAGTINKCAVVTNTGYGDGFYPVYANVKNGRVLSITVSFR